MQHALAINDLLERPDWIRDLAHSLVSDAATADDLIQEAWISALQSSTDDVRDPKSWFARILRNIASKHWRSSSRRETREAKSAKREALPSAADLVTRISLQRDLIGNILALDEKHRDVLILRYFEDCSIAAVAARLEIPLATADSRLHRAKAVLRDRLDAEYGDTSSWCVALLPLALASQAAKISALAFSGAAAATTSTAGGSGLHQTSSQMMSNLVKLHGPKVAAIAAVIGVGLFATGGDDDELGAVGDTGSRPERRESLTAETDAPSPAPNVLAGEGASRTPVATDLVKPPAIGSRVAYNGRLIDPNGDAIPNARVGWAGPSTVYWRPTPGIQKLGDTFDAKPISRAKQAWFYEHPDILPNFLNKDGKVKTDKWLRGFYAEAPMMAEVRTDATGHFTLNIPARTAPGELAEGHPRLILDNFLLHTVAWTPMASGANGRILLAVPTIDLAGQVVDSEGAPISRLRFRLDAQSSVIEDLPLVLSSEEFSPWRECWFETDKEGFFALENVYSSAGIGLDFADRDYEARLEPVPTLSTDDLLIALGDPRDSVRWERRIRGEVVLPDGSPAAMAQILSPGGSGTSDHLGNFELPWPKGEERAPIVIVCPGYLPRAAWVESSPNPLDTKVQTFPVGAQALAISGVFTDADGRPLPGFSVEVFDPTYLQNATSTAEQLASDGPELILTDAEGAFEIAGLADRNYRLSLWDESRGLRLVTDPLAAGASNTTLQLRETAPHKRVTGRVLDRAGAPVVGARIRAGFARVAQGEAQVLPIWQTAHWTEQHFAITDMDGNFAIEDLPGGYEDLHIAGTGIESASISLAQGTTNLRIHVGHLYGFRFVPDSVADYSRIEAFDALGERLPLYTDADRGEVAQRVQLFVTRTKDGFPFCEVPVSARRVTLFGANGATLDVKLTPKAGAVGLLRP